MKTTSRLLLVLATLVALTSFVSAAASNSLGRVRVILIVASNKKAEKDPKLTGFDANLRSLLRFESFRWVAEGTAAVPESGVATGWILTDWMEDFMLRINGEKVYDQWVNHEIPFNDPKVKAVADAVAAYVKNADYLGGDAMVKAIATTKFQDGGLPILDGKCYMHRQASFYSALWPKGTTIAPDGQIWFFYLPSPANGPKYMLGAGDVIAAGTDKPETMDVIAYSGSNEYQTAILRKSQAELSLGAAQQRIVNELLGVKAVLEKRPADFTGR